jgi:HlyD family secretion protein
MRTTNYLILTLLSVELMSCGNTKTDFDAAGAFESVETIISAQATGTILQFDITEGQVLKSGQYLGYIDSTQLYLKKQQLASEIAALKSQMPNASVQVATLQAQLSEAVKMQTRVKSLFAQNAATQQQVEEADLQVEMLKKQIAAQTSTLSNTSSTLLNNIASLQSQVDLLNDQLSKCRIVNPIKGTVLTKYSESQEMATPGKALYKIADTDTLILRVYITGSQLSQIKMGQQVTVKADKGKDEYGEYKGTVAWISDKSEFTPKTIPTKEERADLVYAIKIRVPNDGYLKIGMYGEVKF